MWVKGLCVWTTRKPIFFSNGRQMIAHPLASQQKKKYISWKSVVKLGYYDSISMPCPWRQPPQHGRHIGTSLVTSCYNDLWLTYYCEIMVIYWNQFIFAEYYFHSENSRGVVCVSASKFWGLGFKSHDQCLLIDENQLLTITYCVKVIWENLVFQ